MISHPSRGQFVQLWYRASLRPIARDHGRIGLVLVPAKGRGPRNHAVIFPDLTWTVVPAGNLRVPKDPFERPQPRLFS